MTADQVRADALYRLATRFKGGDNSPNRRIDDLEKIDKLGIDTVDLLEAVERIEFTRQAASYPPLAEILAHCRDARTTRLAHSDIAPQGRTYDRPMNASELAHCRDIMALYRAQHVWCPVCQVYKPNCAVHANRPSVISPTPRQTADALAALPSGTTKPQPVTASVTRIGLTPLSDELGEMF